MSRMIRRLAVFGAAVLAAIAGCGLAFLVFLGGNASVERMKSSLVLGPPLIEVRSPRPAQMYAPGSLPVVVSFSSFERVAPGTFRCLLNGTDVTHQLTLGTHGAAGSVFPLREGENSLRVEVYARGLWLARFFEDAVDVPFRVRGGLMLDRT